MGRVGFGGLKAAAGQLMNLAIHLLRVAQSRGELPALARGPKVLMSYSELGQRAARLAGSMGSDLGLRAGERVCGEHLAIGYFAQHQLDQLHEDESPLQHLLRLDPKASDQS